VYPWICSAAFFIETSPLSPNGRMTSACRKAKQCVTNYFDIHLSIEASEICNAGRISRISVPRDLQLDTAKDEIRNTARGKRRTK
jgi:hypothetical protein